MKIFFTQFFSVFLPPLLQYYGYLMQRVDSLGKTLMLWGVGGRRRRGWQRMRWLDGITNSMDTSLSKFWELVMDREPWHATIHRVSKSQTWLSDHKNRIGHFTQTQPNIHFSNVKMNHLQFSSVTQSFLTLCDHMNCSMPGISVHHQLPESTQAHVHCVSDAIQPSHPLSSLYPPDLHLFQHQGLFKWVSSLHQVTKELEFQFLLLVKLQIKPW